MRIPAHFVCSVEFKVSSLLRYRFLRVRSPTNLATLEGQSVWAPLVGTLVPIGLSVSPTKPPPAHPHCTYYPNANRCLHCLRTPIPALPVAKSPDSPHQMHLLDCHCAFVADGPPCCPKVYAKTTGVKVRCPHNPALAFRSF